MDENKKVVVNLPQGTTKAEITVREGAAYRVLDPKPPRKNRPSGVIGAPVEFLEKRLSEADQIDPKRCHVLVDREKVCITLVTNENDEYTTGRVVGRLSQHPKFSEFGINAGKGWEPNELGQFFKMNRAFFPDKTANMKLVTELKNFEATVNSKVEKQKSEKGDFKDNYSGVVMSNLPEAFTLQIPIFKGMPAETIEVEFYASVNGPRRNPATCKPRSVPAFGRPARPNYRRAGSPHSGTKPPKLRLSSNSSINPATPVSGPG